MLTPKHPVLIVDHRWDTTVSSEAFAHTIFQRVSAKDIAFVKVDFRYCILDGCYLRGCSFDSCDFTGCRFLNSNFHGSTFTGCTFNYATFERTEIASEILDTNCPAFENLKLRFARSLRMNFQGLGDAAAANKAILVELEATEVHLRKAWNSNESYYRKKYPGIHRARSFASWAGFRVAEFLWGNGEKPLNLVRSLLIVLVAIALLDTIQFRDARLVASYGDALLQAPQIFLGTLNSRFSGLAVAGITALRLIGFGLFLSILVRRFARR